MRRELFRDAALLLAATLVVGTLVNLIPKRHLAWWGRGHLPPQVGVDFQWLDPLSADALRTSLPHVVFLDTRSRVEFDTGHVPGALMLSFTDLDRQLTRELLARLGQADGVVLCGVTDEADVEQLLAQELHRRGLAPPSILTGGFPAWQQSGLPVEATP